MALRSKRTPAQVAKRREARVARRRQRQVPRRAKSSRLSTPRNERPRGWARAHYERRRRPHSRGGRSPMMSGISLPQRYDHKSMKPKGRR